MAQEQRIIDGYKVAALYQFKALCDPAGFCEQITNECKKKDITGALIIAREGINGTIAGRPVEMDQIVIFLHEHFDNDS